MYGSLQRREEKRLKVYFKSKKDVNEQFGREVNQDVNGNRKLFWKEVRLAEEIWRLQLSKGWKWEAGTERG